MATEVTKELALTYENATTYLTAHTLGLRESALGMELLMRLYMDGSRTGYATLNDAAKAVLFPNDAARPYQLDVRYLCYGQFDRNNNTAAFSVGGIELYKASGLGQSATQVDEMFTGAVISGMTKATEARFTLGSNSTACAVVIRDATLTLHFWQYACAAQRAGNGVIAASVSDAAPYEGNSVTYTATLKPGATWHGWYRDAACTQLVSTEQSYTVVAGADTTLYASATVESGTGLYVRDGGSYVEAQAVYRRVNGHYVVQTDIAGLLDANVKYVRA